MSIVIVNQQRLLWNVYYVATIIIYSRKKTDKFSKRGFKI